MTAESEDGFDAGPFSMLAVSALEDHVKSVVFAGKEYAAIEIPRLVGNLTPAMIFCRGILGYNDRQELILRDLCGGGERVEPGDWIVMASRTGYSVMRTNGSASLFALILTCR
jgi:hypothetical protein